MDIAVSYTLDGAQASAAADSVRKYELVRSGIGVVACVAGLVVINSLDGEPSVATAGDIILTVTLVAFAVCAVTWLRTAASVRRAAPGFTRPTTVSIADEGLAVAHAGVVAAKVTWQDVAHCTSADGIWVFALKRGRGAVLIPHEALAPADRDQVSALLGTWGKRRLRVTAW